MLMLINKAKDILSNSGIIVYPTETLYGIGTNPFDEKAILKIFDIKKRKKTLPISIAVSNIEMLKQLAEVNEQVLKIYRRFLPGPFTLILKKKPVIPDLLTSNMDTIGVRVPKHDFTLRLIEEFGPITSTSANIHGKEFPINIKIAKKQLGQKVDMYIDYGECQYKSPSAIIDIENKKILRNGPIPVKSEDIYG